MRPRFFLIFLIFFATTGCTTIISEQSRKLVDCTAPFKEIKQAPENFRGKFVLLGGRIVKTHNNNDGGRIEIVQFDLNWNNYPEDTFLSYGRFLATSTDYLDPMIFRRGMLVTVAGKLDGSKTMRLDDMDYTYPLLTMHEWYLWPGSEPSGGGTYPVQLPQYDPYNFGFGYEPFLPRPYNFIPVPR